MMGLKTTEILLIAAVLLLLFGATRLPQLGASMGSAIRNFKKSFGGEGEPTPEETAKEKKIADANGTAATSNDKAASKQG
jgi:TatA/E family protein of Tat protein translocase